jgi:hypothetical protein
MDNFDDAHADASALAAMAFETAAASVNMTEVANLGTQPKRRRGLGKVWVCYDSFEDNDDAKVGNVSPPYICVVLL